MDQVGGEAGQELVGGLEGTERDWVGWLVV